MPLAKIYILRIIQLTIYIDIIQHGIRICEDNKLRISFLNLQRSLLEERKQIRSLLNVIELWRLENA